MSDALRETITAALGAQYEVVRLLGKGGMGAVFLAHERLLDRPVAIKVLPLESAEVSDLRERFLREARIAAKLTHPHIVPLYSFGEAGATLFYIMGYVEGESLEQRLRREGRLSFDETRRIMSELGGALEHAHKHGIVHRDLKPDNVLLEAGTGRAVLTDFGIAKYSVSGGQSLTQTGMVVGTPHYMSPEQAAGERDIDGRSDLYALGVIAYRMITGRLPFDGSSMQEVVGQHLTRMPAPMASVVADIPLDLEAAVTQCLAKSPADRWQGGAQLRDAIAGDDSEVELPPKLERMPGAGVALLANFALIFGVMIGIDLLRGRTPEHFLEIFAAFGIGAVAGGVIMVTHARRNGLSVRRALTMAFWPPKWMRWVWWPNALRRPGDVWNRLPRDVRRVRATHTAWLVSMAAFTIAMVASTGGAEGGGPNVPFVLLPLAATALGGGAILFMKTRIWMRRYALSERDAARLYAEPTWGSRLWKRPEIARVLARATPVSDAGPVDPAELIVALDRLARAMPEAVRPVLDEACSAAREMARGFAQIDAELRALARDADPEELERVRQRLAALGSARGDEPPSTRQMRELLASQLALVEGLVLRRDELAARRSRHVELLRNLWLRASDMRAQQVGDALSAGEVTGRVREACREVERAFQGESEARLAALGLDSPTTPITRHVLGKH